MLKRGKGDRQFRSLVGQKNASDHGSNYHHSPSRMSEQEHHRAPATATSGQPADPLFQRVRITFLLFFEAKRVRITTPTPMCWLSESAAGHLGVASMAQRPI